MTDFTAKRAGETELFAVDFVNLITPGQTIDSAVWTNSTKTGVDSTPNAMIQGDAIINGTQVSTLITGGVGGRVYNPICTATTSEGEVLVLPDIGQGSLAVV